MSEETPVKPEDFNIESRLEIAITILADTARENINVAVKMVTEYSKGDKNIVTNMIDNIDHINSDGCISMEAATDMPSQIRIVLGKYVACKTKTAVLVAGSEAAYEGSGGGRDIKWMLEQVVSISIAAAADILKDLLKGSSKKDILKVLLSSKNQLDHMVEAARLELVAVQAES